MADAPDYELLKDAYAIIDGIPAEAVTLNWNKTKVGLTLTEDTVFHPARWLALYPSFNKLGLTLSDNGRQLLFNGEAAVGGAYSEPLARFFKMPVADVLSLFAERGSRMGEVNPADSDKDIWQRRVREYLVSRGQIAA